MNLLYIFSILFLTSGEPIHSQRGGGQYKTSKNVSVFFCAFCAFCTYEDADTSKNIEAGSLEPINLLHVWELISFNSQQQADPRI